MFREFVVALADGDYGDDWNGIMVKAQELLETESSIESERIEKVARAICLGCDENPDHAGDARGNEFRWQDYIEIAESVINQLG